jgi:hypothetical protein
MKNPIDRIDLVLAVLLGNGITMLIAGLFLMLIGDSS